MSNQDSWTDPNTPTPPAAKKGMSGCMLASLIVGGIGLVGMIACCGVAAWFGPSFLPQNAQGPVEIAAVGRQILNMEIPAEFTPSEGMTIDNPFFVMRIAEFRQKEGKGDILMVSMKVKFGDPNQADLQSRQMRDPFENKIRGTLDIQKTEMREVMIAGQKVSVSVGEGTDRSTNKPGHLVGAAIDQPAGKTFVLMRMDDEIWDEEAVLKMLEDAKAP